MTDWEAFDALHDNDAARYAAIIGRTITGVLLGDPLNESDQKGRGQVKLEFDDGTWILLTSCGCCDGIDARDELDTVNEETLEELNDELTPAGKATAPAS